MTDPVLEYFLFVLEQGYHIWELPHPSIVFEVNPFDDNMELGRHVRQLQAYELRQQWEET